MAPEIPSHYLPLRLANVGIGGGEATLEVTADGFTVEGLNHDLRVVAEPRSVLSPMLQMRGESVAGA